MFQDDNFVEVYSKTTGVKQMVPREWLEDPEGLGADFEVVPGVRATDPAAKPPTIEEVLAEVGDDKAMAAAAYDAEQAREKPRTTLLTKLQVVLDAAPTDSPDQPGTGETTDPAPGQ